MSAETINENNTTVETTESVSHEISLGAEPVAYLGGFTITNSLLSAWVVVAVIVVVSVVVRKKLSIIPQKIQGVFELIIEGALSMVDAVTNERAKSRKILPIILSFFIFILLNNWFGLLPGIGSIGFIEKGAHGNLFVPYFRGGTADVNTTIALAIIAVLGANILGIISIGGWKYFNKFINLKVLAEIPGHFIKEPTVIIVNPIKFFVGIIEIIGEVAKVASLSFRLFGNVFAGEVLLSSMAVIFAFGLPIPFMFLEVLVGIIQALIFGMLTTVYYTIATSHDEH